MRKIIDELNRLTKLYDEGRPEVSDAEWDNLYFKLKQMEEETGIVYPDSPTQSVYFEKVSELKKVKHNHLMLSLDKTKDLNEVKTFLGNRLFVAMAKLDGLSCSLTYENGKLISAETRGNGEIGEDILHNAKIIPSIPKRLNYQDKVTIDGEIICTYKHFENFSSEYKNPRNFSAGSIRLLDSKECAKRKLQFIVWDIIEPFKDVQNTLISQLIKAEHLGFTICPFYSGPDLDKTIELVKLKSKKLSYPIDGIVFKFIDLSLRESLGYTSHHFRNAIAYKFYDESYETEVKDIEWTMGRTGQLTPVAIFKPVEIKGSTVSRASLHNISIMKQILGEKPYIGQKIKVTKMNEIIPQIIEAEKWDNFV